MKDKIVASKWVPSTKVAGGQYFWRYTWPEEKMLEYSVVYWGGSDA